MMVMVMAGAVGVIALAVLMVMVMVFMLMVVIVAAALMVMIVVVLMVVMMLVLIVVVIVIIVVMMMVAGAVGIVALLAVMMMVMVLVFVCLMFGPHLLQQFIGQRDFFNGGEDGLAIQLIPRGSDDGGIGVFLPEHGHGGLQLLLRHLLSPGEDDGTGGLDLVVVELTEVLHIDLHLGGVRHGDKAVELHLGNVLYGVLHRHDHVAELAHAGGLNEDAVGVELSLHVLQSLVEVAHQRAADAAGGHLGDLDAGFLQEAAVNVDLAKFVFDQHQLFTLVGFRQQLFDECGLTGAQEAGDDVDFCHGISPFQKFYTTVIIPRNHKNATPSQKIYSSSGTKKHFCTTGAIFRTFAVSETFFLTGFLLVSLSC